MLILQKWIDHQHTTIYQWKFQRRNKPWRCLRATTLQQELSRSRVAPFFVFVLVVDTMGKVGFIKEVWWGVMQGQRKHGELFVLRSSKNYNEYSRDIIHFLIESCNSVGDGKRTGNGNWFWDGASLLTIFFVVVFREEQFQRQSMRKNVILSVLNWSVQVRSCPRVTDQTQSWFKINCWWLFIVFRWFLHFLYWLMILNMEPDKSKFHSVKSDTAGDIVGEVVSFMVGCEVVGCWVDDDDSDEAS